MKREGFEKARKRLADAFRAHENLQQANDWQSFESAWTSLLTALHSVYSILEQSAKGERRSESWFASAKRQRETDQALDYLHKARNVNDHGIAQVLKHEPGGIAINGNRGELFIKELVIGPRGIETFQGWSLDGSPAIVTRTEDRFVLIPVVARGVTYTPPKQFLGIDLEDSTPLGLASKVLEYMVIFFSDAENLLVKP